MSRALMHLRRQDCFEHTPCCSYAGDSRESGQCAQLSSQRQERSTALRHASDRHYDVPEQASPVSGWPVSTCTNKKARQDQGVSMLAS